MAFKLKRHRKKKKKKLTKEEIRKKKLALIKKALKKIKAKKINSKKLNNNKQNEAISININITNDINTGMSGDSSSDLMPGHIRSTTGSYRRGLIDNLKQ